MNGTSGPRGRAFGEHRRFWHCAFLAVVFALLLMLAGQVGTTPSAFAAPLTPSQNTFTVSPTQGPVGAVISVSATGVILVDGTQVSLGYTADYRTCTLVSGGKTGVVQGGAFNGWFRWPATNTGTFGVCATANNVPFQIGSYQVLSASAPRISLASAKLNAGQQATVSGTNFLPGGANVALLLRPINGGRSVVLGTASSSGDGTFTQTFTVPGRTGTGSYALSAIVGNSALPTLSAETTVHVDGVTLVAVPTPTTALSPTAVPTSLPASVPTTASHTVPVQPPVSVDTGANTSVFVPLSLGGGVLVILALIAGVLVVRRQRRLNADPTSGPLLWPEAVDTMLGSAHGSAGPSTPWPGTMYPGGGASVVNPGRAYGSAPEAITPQATWIMPKTIPFDPGLAEAMREAQVSLFATPRPPVSEEIEVQ
jgi:hypothetical protein